MESARQILDEGGFARLDVSDLLPPEDEDREDEARAPALGPCDWCQSPRRGGGEYLVVADRRHYQVCATCWGRSPGYVGWRQKGVGHQEALARLGAAQQ